MNDNNPDPPMAFLPYKYVLAGEYREPRRGEWFLSPKTGHIIKSGTYTEHPEKAWIVKERV